MNINLIKSTNSFSIWIILDKYFANWNYYKHFSEFCFQANIYQHDQVGIPPRRQSHSQVHSKWQSNFRENFPFLPRFAAWQSIILAVRIYLQINIYRLRSTDERYRLSRFPNCWGIRAVDVVIDKSTEGPAVWFSHEWWWRIYILISVLQRHKSLWCCCCWCGLLAANCV